MTLKDRAHAIPAVVGAVITVVGTGATVIAEAINLFGGHVSGMDVIAKTAVVGAAITVGSMIVDSANDAWKGRKTAPVVVAATAPPTPTTPPVVDASVIRAIGAVLSSYGGPA